MKYALLTLMALLVCTAMAANAADMSTETAPSQTGGKGGHGEGAFRQKLLEKFDTNHDGKLDDAEKAAMKEAMKARMLEKFDTNHDGKLDDTERAAMKAAMKAAIEQRRAQHGGGQGQGGKMSGMRGRFGKHGNGDSGTPQKTNSDATTDADSVQKVMDQVDAKPSVRF